MDMDKRYEHAQFECQAQKLWEEKQTYSANNNPGPRYSIDTPPPTVSGSLHIGHLFSYTQTDIIARYKRMNGFSVFYPFGFDDNGLPTERYVEKKRSIQAHNLSRSEFISICLEETKAAQEAFKQLWQRMGLSVDWNNAYSTISDSVRTLSQQSFIELYKKGFIYRKQEPALYCINCRTSVAQAELDDQETPSFFNDIVFKDAHGNDLLIGTTRPELLPSCVAVFYHPNDQRYTHLNGTHATVPLFNFTVPILPDELVDPNKGTGLVMCCTFGDKTDIVWFKKYNLSYKQSIGLDGKWAPWTGILAGLRTTAARQTVIDALKSAHLLVNQKPITHSVNVHERCKKEIEFVVLNQWFISILEHKKELVALADSINWYPHFMKSRYQNWVENLGWDWCISRQRFYGVPFPAWHCTDCNDVILAKEDQLPIDPQETTAPSCPKCHSTNVVADTDVMDTWNTSSITPYICYALFNPSAKNPFVSSVDDFIPMSMRPQAHDIIRTWAFYTIAKAWMHHGKLAWKEIVISGHVLSTDKEKISKSKDNNPLAPENLLALYPADAIRYWTASGSLGHDIAFSESQLKVGIKLITKLWNAFRFAQPHIQALENPTLAPKQLDPVHQWILHTQSACFAEYSKYLEQHEFGLALNAAEQFFWNNFCDNYLELIKNQLFNPDSYSQDQIYATRWTLYHTGLRILQLYAPYLPHVTETLYQQLYSIHEKTPSLHQTQFKVVQQRHYYPEQAALIDDIIEIIGAARKLKTEKELSLKVPFATLTIAATKERLELYSQQEPLIKGITQAEHVLYTLEQLKTELVQQDEQWHAYICIRDTAA